MKKNMNQTMNMKRNFKTKSTTTVPVKTPCFVCLFDSKIHMYISDFLKSIFVTEQDLYNGKDFESPLLHVFTEINTAWTYYYMWRFCAPIIGRVGASPRTMGTRRSRTKTLSRLVPMSAYALRAYYKRYGCLLKDSNFRKRC